MNKFGSDFTSEFEKHLKKIRSDINLQKRLREKIEEILVDPFHYKPLRNVLKNKRRTHIGSYVLIFEIRQKENVVVFHSFLHHDRAYQ
ncbi:hypothetical protein UR09_02395 [Candidatus Nitromaritima sp. SCGC AAA799-A02]|nr:hypothetical protein UZ36_03350 [Candidatus Nitromaritima sp. SCGC AAA799-C22]KMP11839.1 hypothetical protein UR09_02395 [Candidatus Nitromaritima sp. SCGC AAA799-A02]